MIVLVALVVVAIVIVDVADSQCIVVCVVIVRQDGLTNEEMRPYIARVMHKDNTLSTGKPGDHLDAADWMTYSTALLVKAMLEFENYKTMCVESAATNKRFVTVLAVA